MSGSSSGLSLIQGGNNYFNECFFVLFRWVWLCFGCSKVRAPKILITSAVLISSQSLSCQIRPTLLLQIKSLSFDSWVTCKQATFKTDLTQVVALNLQLNWLSYNLSDVWKFIIYLMLEFLI